MSRLEDVDTDRRHEDAPSAKACATQHLMEQVRGGPAHLFGALDHRRQRNARQRAGQRIVIDTNDGDLLRHGYSRNQAHLQHVARAGVGHRDDAHGLGQAL